MYILCHAVLQQAKDAFPYCFFLLQDIIPDFRCFGKTSHSKRRKVSDLAFEEVIM